MEQARAVVGDPVRKADVYDLEQAIWTQVAADRLTAVLEGSLTAEEILTDHFVRQLHTDLYVRIWTWAGRHRRLETNIGVAPEQIANRCVPESMTCVGDGCTRRICREARAPVVTTEGTSFPGPGTPMEHARDFGPDEQGRTHSHADDGVGNDIVLTSSVERVGPVFQTAS